MPARMGLGVTDLSCTRGGRPVLHRLGLALADGEALLLRGPNGAGKSTLLRALAGLLPASGRIELDGRAADRDALAEAVGYAGHLDAVKPQLTVAENLALLGRRSSAATPPPALDGFDLAGIADRPAHLLSAGQKRRLGLARLLLAPRRLWLLDEPTVALDAAAEARLLARRRRATLAAGGLAVIATHAPLALAGARADALARRPPPAPARRRPLPRRSLGVSAARAAPRPRADAGAPLRRRRRARPRLLRDRGAAGAARRRPRARAARRASPPARSGSARCSPACCSLDRLFQADLEDGTLDVLALAPLPLEALVALKALAHWLTTGLPLVVAAPLLAPDAATCPAPAYPWLVACLAAGTPALSFLGAIGAALTVGIRRGGLLLAILVLPLYLPTLIFGARAAAAAAEGARPLAALPAPRRRSRSSSLALAPFAAAAARARAPSLR